jgi:hypothetical protein
MNGVVLGFEIAAGVLLFIVTLFLLIALPLWSLRGWPILCVFCKGWAFPNANGLGF